MTCLACGRKGPLRLDPRPEPTEIADIDVRQVGTDIELSWTFPQMLGDGSTQFDFSQLRWIRCYHANRPAGKGKFHRQAEAMRKLKPGELEREGTVFRLRIPFKPGELAGKRHFFSIQYAYKRHKSPLAPVKEFITGLPPMPVTGLKAVQEGKTFCIEWIRPKENIQGKPLKSLAGYILYRRVLPSESNAEGMMPRPVTSRPLLGEKYEDQDTSTEGKYEYRVAALLSPGIESSPSEPVSLDMKDTYPPDTPGDVVVFRARDHLLINWRVVRERDFSHYRIYRKVDNEEEFTLLADRVEESRYEDRSIKTGHTYAYQVTAVDEKGNESPPSPAVDEAF